MNCESFFLLWSEAKYEGFEVCILRSTLVVRYQGMAYYSSVRRTEGAAKGYSKQDFKHILKYCTTKYSKLVVFLHTITDNK